MSKEKTRCKNCGRIMDDIDIEEGCVFCKTNKSIFSIENTMAVILKGIALIILIIGFIVGIFNTSEMYSIWINHFVYFLVLFSVGEIIQILHDIRAKIY